MPFEVPARVASAEPDSARLAAVRLAFAESAQPVHPLPSNALLMLLCAGVFVVLAILLAMPVGFYGFAKVSARTAVMEFSVVFLLAMVLAGIVVEQMVPGSRRVMRPAFGILLAILLLSLTTTLLFPDFVTRDFVRRGIPCLRYGVLCAIPGAGLTWILMRRGFIVEPLAAAIAAGGLAGLLGVGVLALHCPILEAPHIVVWHVGVIAVTSVAGALLGLIPADWRAAP